MPNERSEDEVESLPQLTTCAGSDPGDPIPETQVGDVRSTDLGTGSSDPSKTFPGSMLAAIEPFALSGQFGDYVLIGKIGQGAMGSLYKVRHKRLNKVVALKTILAGRFATRADVRRFQVEAEAAAALDHPNLVPVYEIGELGGHHYYSMRFVEGTDLSKRMDAFLDDPASAARLMVKIARAVHYAHQHGILHRDLKPQNILLQGGLDRPISECEPMVADFGLAKRLDADASFTVTGAVFGTPAYMSPEQARGDNRKIVAASDIFSLGVILYEMLTGARPFRGETNHDLMMQVIGGEPRPPRSLRTLMDRDLETIVLKCLEKDPARRYPSAEALANDLQNWLDGEPILARPLRATERAARWLGKHPAVASFAATLVTTAIVGLVLILRETERARHSEQLTAIALAKEQALAVQLEAARKQLENDKVLIGRQLSASESQRRQIERMLREAAAKEKALIELDARRKEALATAEHERDTARSLLKDLDAARKKMAALAADNAKAAQEAGEALKKTALLEKDLGASRDIANRAQQAFAIGCYEFAQAHYAEAIKNFDKSIDMKEDFPNAYRWRATSYRQLGTPEADLHAIDDYTKAIAFDPNDPSNYRNRGLTYRGRKQVRAALDDFEKAISLKDESWATRNDAAWILATDKSSDIRDGAKAVAYAKNALEVAPEESKALALDTLAAAYAEAGDFLEAIRSQVESLKDPKGLQGELEGARKRLSLYRAGKPFRE